MCQFVNWSGINWSLKSISRKLQPRARPLRLIFHSTTEQGNSVFFQTNYYQLCISIKDILETTATVREIEIHFFTSLYYSNNYQQY